LCLCILRLCVFSFGCFGGGYDSAVDWFKTRVKNDVLCVERDVKPFLVSVSW